MISITFFAVIASVSATFVGLVFIGLSIYMARIRTAAKEVEAKWEIKEQSSRLMSVSTLSNLFFFLLPLIASLNLISKNKNLNAIGSFYATILVYLFMLGALIWSIINKRIKQQLKHVYSQKDKIRRLFYLRLKGCKWVLCLAILMFGYLSVSIIISQSRINWVNNILEFSSVIFLILGLSIGIIDLFFFDINNILFEITDRSKNHVDRVQNDIQREMGELEKFFGQFKKMIDDSPDYEEYLDQNTTQHVKAIYGEDRLDKHRKEEENEILKKYEELNSKISKADGAKFLKGLKQKGEFVKYSDLKVIKENVESLSADIKSLKGKLTQKTDPYKTWKQKKNANKSKI